jgi:hypothetical protein
VGFGELACLALFLILSRAFIKPTPVSPSSAPPPPAWPTRVVPNVPSWAEIGPTHIPSREQSLFPLQQINNCPPSLLLAKVYNPSRLQIIDTSHPLRTVTTQVRRVTHPRDKDYHLELDLATADHAQLSLNGSKYFVAEIMPTDTSLPLPQDGDTVTLTGVWVFDTSHGHYELHPLQAVAIIGGASGTTLIGDCPGLLPP